MFGFFRSKKKSKSVSEQALDANKKKASEANEQAEKMFGCELPGISDIQGMSRISILEEQNLNKYGDMSGPHTEILKIKDSSDSKVKEDIINLEKQNKKRKVQTPAGLDPDIIYGTRPQNSSNNVFLYILAGGIFCVMLVCGVTLSAAFITKQITVSSADTTNKLVESISKSIGRPVDSIGGEADEMADKALDSNTKDIEDCTLTKEELDGMYMKAITQYPDAVKKAAGMTWEELKAFDDLVRYVSEETNNPIIEEIFNTEVTTPINNIAEGYKIWAYIMSVRSATKSGIEPGVALLEAASLVKYSTQYNVPLALAVGVTQTESNFNPSAISHKSALGPMQVVYKIHYAMLGKIGIKNRDDLFTADKGIQAGCYVLGRYLKDEKSLVGGLKRYYGVLSPKYVNSVIAHRHTYELYTSGVDKNVALLMKKENVNWNKMTEAKVPVIKASSTKTKSTTVKKPMTTTATVAQQASKPAAVPQAMTIYKNTGSISIKKPDGSVQEWSN